jgi:hypothetical protein
VSPRRLGRPVLPLRAPSQIRGVYPSWRNLFIALYWARIRGIEAEQCERRGGPDAYHGSYWAGEKEDWHSVLGRTGMVLCLGCFDQAREGVQASALSDSNRSGSMVQLFLISDHML